jgi:hypothetical protein
MYYVFIHALSKPNRYEGVVWYLHLENGVWERLS